MKPFLNRCKVVLHTISLFFVAVWRALKKSAAAVFSPDIKPGVRRVRRMFGAALGVLARILLILFLTVILTGSIMGVFGAIYVTRYLDVSTDFNLDHLQLDLTTHIWAEDPDDPERHVLLATLSGRENRVWISFADIPENLINAVVAIEDERFWSHDGVDWKRTIGAFYNLFAPGGGGQFGGSTITQQLIKNATGNNEATVARKLEEIFRALAVERNYPGRGGKELILELYLNTVYFGSGCYGIVTAAEQYFGKPLDELTQAESASLVGITNNPSVFNPYTNPRNNKRRQEVILYKMHELGMLTRHEYNLAKYQPLTFARTDTSAGGDALRSWFVDQIIRDATADLMDAFGWSDAVARQEIFSGGYNIYACVDLKLQAEVDAIWADDDRWPESPDAEPAESSIIVVDHRTGDIKAMIGGREKTGNLVFDRSTRARRQPGSSIKPLTTYAPAFDLGLLHPYSPVDDIPLRREGSRGWPINSPNRYEGFTNVLQAITVSKNAIAAAVVDMVGPERAFEYGHDRFGMTSLIESRTIGNEVFSDIDLAPLSLGGLTEGVTVREMTAAYAAIANGGILNKTRTYTHITDQNGYVFFENRPSPTIAIKEKTAFYLETALISATRTGGTGWRAQLDNMPIAGKTGTTSRNLDRWFAGYTPYYTAVCWFGYDIGRDMSYYNTTGVGNPALHMWRSVMAFAHEGLERREFERPEGVNAYTYCIDSGLPVGPNCHLDPRGGARTAVGYLDRDDIPRHSCNLHVAVDLCTLSGRLATPYCPHGEHMRRTVALLDTTRWVPIPYLALADEQYTIRRWAGGTPAAEPDEPDDVSVPAAGSGEERYRAVATTADGAVPFNTFCSYHTFPSNFFPEIPGEGGENGENPPETPPLGPVPGEGNGDGDNGETPALPPEDPDLIDPPDTWRDPWGGA
ncbi:MAG: transglycosylase domain-containing protein [Oscillospiraceae bacterium]|nr:transglycosylase domain-containing protein [Oscillospiraceae bacterium]